MRYRQTFLVVFSILFAACSEQENESKPKIDLSSPDHSVISFWWQLKWNEYTERPDTSAYEFFDPSLRVIFRGQVQAELRKRDSTYHARITDEWIERVNTESDTRATVVTNYKSNDDTKSRTYILSRHEDQWLLQEIRDECWTCGGSGKVDDFEKRLSHIREYGRVIGNPSKTCSQCEGRKWVNITDLFASAFR